MVDGRQLSLASLPLRFLSPVHLGLQLFYQGT